MLHFTHSPTSTATGKRSNPSAARIVPLGWIGNAPVRHRVVESPPGLRGRQQLRVLPHALTGGRFIRGRQQRRHETRHRDNHAPRAGATGDGTHVIAARSLLANAIVVAAREDVRRLLPSPQQRRHGEQFQAIVTRVEHPCGDLAAPVARARSKIKFELRTAGPKELVYEAQLPLMQPTDRISNAILTLDPSGETEVVRDEKKK
jgi:hypothetical protein